MLAGIILVFLIGSTCMIVDMIYNNEPEAIVVRKSKPKPVSVLVEDYTEIDAVTDWEELNTDNIKNS
jgi:hypothetical protein